MKFLNQLRYLLFAIMLIGLFASFAQNEYGVDMMQCSGLFIGFIFWIEAVYYKIQYKKLIAAYLFSEHFWMGSFMFGSFFRYMHWPGAGPLMVLAMVFLVTQYLIYACKNLFKTYRNEKLRSVLIFCFFLITITSIAGFTFKIMHWPGAELMLTIAGLATVIGLLFTLILKGVTTKDNTETLFQQLALLRGKVVIVMCYFVFWSSYMLLSNVGILPGLYTLSKPPAAEKLLSNGNEQEAGKYWENYESFLDNRYDAEHENSDIKITVNGAEVKRQK